MRKTLLFAFAALLAGGLAAPALAQMEQREDTVNMPPDQVQDQSPAADLQLTDAIRADAVYVTKQYIQRQSKNGMFAVRDPESREQMQLTYQDAPENQVKMIGPDSYVVQGNFKDQDGRTCQVDFWVQGADRSAMKVTRAMIQSVDGQERYQWEQTQGNMYRQRQMQQN